MTKFTEFLERMLLYVLNELDLSLYTMLKWSFIRLHGIEPIDYLRFQPWEFYGAVERAVGRENAKIIFKQLSIRAGIDFGELTRALSDREQYVRLARRLGFEP